MTRKSHETVAFFAGSFNPFTIGHASVVERALAVFDKVVIAIGVNALKSDICDADERWRAIDRVYAAVADRVQVITYTGLTVEAAAAHGATALLRGVRTVADFEYERTIADVNRRISGLETVMIYALPGHECVSSSVVRELMSYDRDVSEFLPQPVSADFGK